MRVLLTTDYYPPHVGGGAEATLPVVVASLVRKGHQVQVVTLNTEKTVPVEEIDGSVVYRAPTLPMDRYLGLQFSFSPSLPSFVSGIVRSFAPDIIWAHNHFFTTAAAAHWASRHSGVPVMTDLSLADVNYLPTFQKAAALGWEKTISRWMLRRSAVLTGVSQACIDHAEDLMGHRTVTGIVVPNGVDTQKFFPAERPVQPPTVGFVGRLIHNKGPQRLIEAIPCVVARYPNVKFAFIGDGPLRKSLESRVKALRIDGHVEFHGLVDHDLIPERLRSMSMVVRPSDTEGLPVIALEAMATGIPLVATDVGGTAEVLEHGVTGLLLQANPDPSHISDAINYLLGDPDAMSRMGVTARSVTKKLDWEHCVDMREQVLLEYGRAK